MEEISRNREFSPVLKLEEKVPVRRHSRHPLRASALCGSDLFRRESSWELAPPHTGADSERDACLAPAELADDNKMEKSAGLCRDERSLVIQALRTTSVEVLPKGAP